MNSISISGSLGRDCETRYMPNGDPVTSFSVADSQGKDKETIWWNCQLFGKRAESLAPYLLKGQSLTVIGNVTERKWSEKNGTERKTMEIRVQDIALQGGRKESEQQKPSKAQPKSGGISTPDNFDPSDVPF